MAERARVATPLRCRGDHPKRPERRFDIDDVRIDERATRLDAATGTTELIELLGSAGERVFTGTYLPPSQPVGAVLICPAIHSEFTRNYRREVLLARRLARDGFVVQRFHYRYTGNSDGDGRDLTFESMRQDALRGFERLRGHAVDVPMFALGTRWGALIGASAAAEHDDTGLVLWEPVLDATRFFRDAFRTRLVFERRSGVERPSTSAELAERLRAGASVDVVGNTIEPGLYESSSGRSLEGELGMVPRSALLLQIGPSSTVRADLSNLADRWREAGLEVDVQIVQGDETWWLVDERWPDEGARPMTNRLIELTATWTARAARKEPA